MHLLIDTIQMQLYSTGTTSCLRIKIWLISSFQDHRLVWPRFSFTGGSGRMTTGAQTYQSRQLLAEKADSRPPMAVKEKIDASMQNQALSALQFFYRGVIGREVGDLGEGWSRVRMPDAPDRKYPKAPKDFCRQRVFPPVIPLPHICLRWAAISALSKNPLGPKTPHDHGLHPCTEQRRPRRTKSGRGTVTWCIQSA
jgi:hypothetical protein